MCEVLGIARSTYYYESKKEPENDSLNKEIIKVFKASRNNYGTRKIKIELEKKGLIVSRRRIGRIMKAEELVSSYTVAQLKPFKSKVNEVPVKNILNRAFDYQAELAVVVSDLTYVRVNGNGITSVYLLTFLIVKLLVTALERTRQQSWYTKHYQAFQDHYI